MSVLSVVLSNVGMLILTCLLSLYMLCCNSNWSVGLLRVRLFPGAIVNFGFLILGCNSNGSVGLLHVRLCYRQNLTRIGRPNVRRSPR